MIKYEGISTLEILEGLNNYNAWITDSIIQNVSYPVLEIGAGTGNISTFIAQKKGVYLSDIDHGLIKHLKEKFKNRKNNIFQWDITKKCSKQYKNYFKCVYGINVLEHIKEDNEALKNIYDVLTKKGVLILLVPAKKIAYTRFDKKLGHYRRYEQGELYSLLTSSGFIVKKIYFFNFLGLLSWYIRDKVEKKNVEFSPFHIQVFDMIVPILRMIENIKTPPVGISLIAVAQKS